jgi:GntR family transcriptional repressor for pyruvate dehydrogenase complex
MNVGQPLVRELGLADRVADHLKQQVMDGTLKRGTRLPPDRLLAEQYGVSRTVVREAVRTLVGQGLLETIGGSGTYVRSPDPRAVAESMAMMLRLHHGVTSVPYAMVHEVRMVLEVDMAGLAAERAQAEDLITMEREIERQRTAGNDREIYVASDVAFHAAIATASRNPLFPVLLNAISDVMAEVRRLGFNVSGMYLTGLTHHQHILEAIAAHDAAAAIKAMKAHLRDSERIMVMGLKIEAARQEQEG